MRLNGAYQTAVTTTGAACLEIIAPPNRSCTVMEIDGAITAATASEFGLGFPAAAGITPTKQRLTLNGSLAGFEIGTRVAVAWGTPPTLPAAFSRRAPLAAAIGSSFAWPFDDFKSDKPNGIVIPAGQTLVIWNLSTVSVLDVELTIEEKWGQW